MSRKYAAGITEKRLNNHRFRKTEDAILRVFFENNVYIGAKEMAERAGVARSTFYHHHKTIGEIIPDYKRFIMRKYLATMGVLIKRKQVEMRKIYSETLFFIMRNRKVFEIMVKGKESVIVKEMLERIKPKMMERMRLGHNKDKILMVYNGEIAELICEWCESGFCENDIVLLLDNIMYLTDTVKTRLGGLA